MAGGAGYPQFEGPGAAQYGNEPVEPPPPLPRTAGQQPSYGPSGTGPGFGAAPGYPPPPPPAPAPAPGVSKGPVQQTPGYHHSGAQALDVGQSIGYGIERFRANAGPWLGVTAIGVLIYLTVVALVQVFDPTSLFGVLLLFLVVLVGLWLLQAAMVRGALYETDGYPPAFASFFRFVNAGNVLLTALLAFGATLIASLFLVLPGVLVGMLCMFSVHYVIDQDMGPFEALRASGRLVLANVWAVVLLTLTVMLITFVGALLCGIGLLFAGPVCTIAVTYAYRMLTGGPVARV